MSRDLFNHPGKPTQLTLDLSAQPRFDAENFLVSASNEQAYALIEAWPNWPSRNLLLIGPSGAGKSHLGDMWAKRSQAQSLPAQYLGSVDIPALAAQPALLVEDIDRLGADQSKIETALFHLFNLTNSAKVPLLFTSRVPASALDITTPDLLSRLRQAAVAQIGSPDEALIRAVIVKLFVDRQLVVDTGIVDYIALHIERSLDAARSAVAALDVAALASGKRISRPMAAEILKNIDGTEP